MPTYDYICDACGHEFECFESIMIDPQTVCPACQESKLRRKIGPGAAILFKGSGFYQTDYRSDSYKKGAEAEKSASKPSGGSDATSKTDSTSKTEPSKPVATASPAPTPSPSSSPTSNSGGKGT